MQFIACHGGSASDPRHEDGPQLACQRGLEILSEDGSALEAVICATEVLENDARFNAGTGSNIRLDGKTIQMDAACMTNQGKFGGVAVIESVKNPIRVARHVLDTPHVLLAGDGATTFARQCGFEEYDPTTEGAQDRYAKIFPIKETVGEWSVDSLKDAWNYSTPLRQVIGGDTVGAVAWDGKGFACALSSGGLTAVLDGRVGDVPLPGCGLFAGPCGSVAATGDGEHLARSLLAHRVYLQLERGELSREEIVLWTLKEFPEDVDVGLIILDRYGFSGGARHGMAWHGASNSKGTTP